MNNTSEPYAEPDIISNEAQYMINLWLMAVATTLAAIPAMITNYINVIVFIRQGLKEHVNFTLFYLSISDLLMAVSVLGYSLLYCGKVSLLPSTIEYESFIGLFVWMRCLFADLSSALTVFISTVRCLCVTLPFKFNSSFTLKKTQIIIAIITLFVLVDYVPILGTIELVGDVDENGVVIYKLVYSEVNFIMSRINDYLFGSILAGMCQFCVFVCAVLMLRGLRKSSEVRENTRKLQSKKDSGKQTAQVLSTKEKRVVKMVLMMACLYLPASVPQITASLARVHVPGLVLGTYTNACDTIVGVVLFCSTVYASVNIFIYHTFSTNFRLNFIFRKSK
ncbi:uncharacterized protein LOC131942568 [Physella acuta]|uniref:uncharacterized protein LOC131942568 n=1 Tax=Physella acuta TaxID=109671 RepID=UPI0027DDDB22|nr:uncharacterized protein LOC131942568 [Physella acuta]